jgi:hypothetical protein
MSEDDFLAGPNVDIEGSGNLAQKRIEDKNTAQQSQQAALSKQNDVTQAVILYTDFKIQNIIVKTTEKEVKEEKKEVKEEKKEERKIEGKKVDERSIQNLVAKKENVNYSKDIQLLNGFANKFNENTKEGKIVRQVIPEIIDFLKKTNEERTKEDHIKYNKNLQTLRNLDTSKFNKEEKEAYNELMEGLEKTNNKVLKEFLGINNSPINERMTLGPMNYIMNYIAISNQAKEKNYEKTSREIYEVMEYMKDYLRNPTGAAPRMHEEDTVNNNAVGLCTLYYAEAQKDYYNTKDNLNYAQANENYLKAAKPMIFTYINEKGETVTKTGEEYLKEKELDLTYKGKPLTGFDLLNFYQFIAYKPGIEDGKIGEMGMA